MKIRNVINALQRFEQDNPDMNVSICLNVSKRGVLANNNFIFKNIDDRDLLLISPSDNHWAEQLANRKWENIPDGYRPPLLTPCGEECEPLQDLKTQLNEFYIKYGPVERRM